MQNVHVHPKTRALHVVENGHQGQFDVAVNVPYALLLEASAYLVEDGQKRRGRQIRGVAVVGEQILRFGPRAVGVQDVARQGHVLGGKGLTVFRKGIVGCLSVKEDFGHLAVLEHPRKGAHHGVRIEGGEEVFAVLHHVFARLV